MALFECGACRRHVRSHETSCPFCGIVRATMVVAAAALVVGCATPQQTMYGGPPVDISPRLDAGDSDASTTSTAPTTTTTTATSTATALPPAPAYGGPPPPPTMAPMYGMPPSATSPRK